MGCVTVALERRLPSPREERGGSWQQERSSTWSAAGVLVALAALTACSGGGAAAATPAIAGSADEAPEPAIGAAGAGQPGAAIRRRGRPAGANRTVVSPKSVITTGEVALTAKDLRNVRAEIDDLLPALDGTVDSEETQNDRKGRIEQSTLVLRVPVEQFTAAKNALEGWASPRLRRERKDVTTQVIDVDERVQTLQNSLDSLQGYQRDAKDVRDLLDYEEKITTRQAELQSLKSQQSYLPDQTSMSTITVHLSTPEKYVPPPDALEDAGFLSRAQVPAGTHLGDVFVVVPDGPRRAAPLPGRRPSCSVCPAGSASVRCSGVARRRPCLGRVAPAER